MADYSTPNLNMQLFRASASRITPSEAKYMEVSVLILAHINTLKKPEDAESLWLAFLEQGHKISISAFYRHLRKLTEAGSIIKNPVSKHKFQYFHQ